MSDFSILDIPEFFSTLLRVIINHFNYGSDWFFYSLSYIVDTLWYVLATFINFFISLASCIFDLISVVFVWSGTSTGPVFVYFVATLVFLTFVFFLFRVIIAFKNLILRWT